MAVVQGPQIAITPSASTIPIEQVRQHSAGPAIVLSGGGTKGDFEVGAVRCLYEQGILPNILCGTSVGSVNALKLAEGEDHRVRAGDPAPTSPPRPQGHVRGLAGLEAISLGLKSDQDIWMLEPGIADIFNTLAKLPAEAKALLAQADDVKTDTVGGCRLDPGRTVRPRLRATGCRAAEPERPSATGAVAAFDYGERGGEHPRPCELRPARQ